MKVVNIGGQQVGLYIWDTWPRAVPQFERVLPDAAVIIVVYYITHHESFDGVLDNG